MIWLTTHESFSYNTLQEIQFINLSPSRSFLLLLNPLFQKITSQNTGLLQPVVNKLITCTFW